MNKITRSSLILLAFGIFCAPVAAAESSCPFVGCWALTIPGGGAGWLGVTEQVDARGRPYLDAGILWGGGSVVPVSSVFADDDTLYITRIRNVDRGAKDIVRSVKMDGSFVRENFKTEQPSGRTQQFVELITAQISGDTLYLKQFNTPEFLGRQIRESDFVGKRIPPLPPKPDLSKVKFGEPIQLFNGQNLDGWKLTNSRQTSGWSVRDGILTNNPAQKPGQPHISYGNLQTEREFEDFNLKVEVMVPPGGNSGIYLRGIYEVQVADTFGRPLDPHNMGAVYSRISPRVNAEKPANEWQTVDITLCDRHVTVILNGVVIIDNEPLMGCTGGAMWSDEFRPGPIYLQGDHTGVSYRSVVLTPIEK
ncbi:MAG: 3-keto-disaccharide hydrolase [Candidatus Hinthialibacter sp.]